MTAQLRAIDAPRRPTPIETVREVFGALGRDTVPDGRILRRAAVAAIFRAQGDGDVELFFIKRAEHPGDRWSGHMAFPGGRVEDHDLDTRAAAVRETREEVGIDLRRDGRPLATLSDTMAVARGKVIPMAITPFVYELTADVETRLNHEVDEVHWIPLDFLLDERNRSTMEYRLLGKTLQLPCYRWKGRVVWGLTLRMLDEALPHLRAAFR